MKQVSKKSRYSLHTSHVSNNVFVEASSRVQNIIADSIGNIPNESENILSLDVKHGKQLKFFLQDGYVHVIDDTFCDMFSTAFISLTKLPAIYVGSLDTYKMVVYLLFKQLKWLYDEEDKFLAFFRKETRNNISKLDDNSILWILENRYDVTSLLL
jgi:hypothetical protein